MAKIKLSAIVSEMRGKLNGSVFSKNRGGAYIRTKVTPINPNTLSQGLVRATMTALSQGWRNLLQSERDAWNTAVSNFTGTDIFGDIRTPSGINLYTKLNLNLANINIAPINLPPLPNIVGYVDSLSFLTSAGAGTLSATFTAINATVGQSYVVEATAGMSAGKNFVKSEFRVIGVLPGTSVTPMALGALYTAKFGAMTAGRKIFIRLKLVDATSGVAGQYTAAKEIVLA